MINNNMESSQSQEKAGAADPFQNPNARNVFEVPSDLPREVTTLYKLVRSERIGTSSTPFNRRYHGEFYPQTRTRYSKSFLEKRLSKKDTFLTPNDAFEQDFGLYVTNKFDP
jgi:hypothetical protein